MRWLLASLVSNHDLRRNAADQRERRRALRGIDRARVTSCAPLPRHNPRHASGSASSPSQRTRSELGCAAASLDIATPTTATFLLMRDAWIVGPTSSRRIRVSSHWTREPRCSCSNAVSCVARPGRRSRRVAGSCSCSRSLHSRGKHAPHDRCQKRSGSNARCAPAARCRCVSRHDRRSMWTSRLNSRW